MCRSTSRQALDTFRQYAARRLVAELDIAAAANASIT
jgi:hypothetical protein